MADNSERAYQVPTPKTTKERIEWLRNNDKKFKDEEKLVDDVRKNIKPK